MTRPEDFGSDGVRLLDGGTGSELRRRGVALSALCWSAAASLDHADLLLEIHRDYIRAGADIVTANTFAATRFVLDAGELADRSAEIVAGAVRAARRAADDADRQIAVAASLSCLPPGFDRSAYPPRDAEYRAYCELAEGCAAHGADLILLEMLQEPAHAGLACRAAAATGLPFWTGISCRRLPATAGAARDRLVGFDDSSVPFEAVLDTVLGYGPDAVGIMHSPLDAMLPALDRLRHAWPGPIAAYAELPYPEDPAVTASAGVSPERYALAAGSWLDHGASIVGGCCGTTPAHIASLRGLVCR